MGKNRSSYSPNDRLRAYSAMTPHRSPALSVAGPPGLTRRRPVPGYTPMPGEDAQEALSALSNAQLLARLDGDLLELEKRLFRYARVGPELLQMADEGLVLTVRARARLGQALSATQHAEGHLQILAVGDWRPRSTQPSWHDDPRVTDETDD